jgi:hypothetical protein
MLHLGYSLMKASGPPPARATAGARDGSFRRESVERFRGLA